jgi:hypothetical protein
MYFHLIPKKVLYFKLAYSVDYAAMYPYSDVLRFFEDKNVLIASKLRKTVAHNTPLSLIPGLEVEHLARIIRKDGI